jgi:hypothetical protein
VILPSLWAGCWADPLLPDAARVSVPAPIALTTMERPRAPPWRRDLGCARLVA